MKWIREGTLKGREAPSMGRAYSGPGSRIWDSRGHVYETRGRSRLWNREDAFMGQDCGG